MHKIAQNITVNYDQKRLLIDGEDFPFYVQAKGPTVSPDPTDDSRLFVVSLPVLTESFDVIGRPEVSDG